MITYKTIEKNRSDKQFGARHADLMDDAARQWLSKVEQGFEMERASELTEAERQQLDDAQLATAKAQGTEASLIATRRIEQARLDRIQEQLDKRRKARARGE